LFTQQLTSVSLRASEDGAWANLRPRNVGSVYPLPFSVRATLAVKTHAGMVLPLGGAFGVVDDPWAHMGPIMDRGRIVLRQWLTACAVISIAGLGTPAAARLRRTWKRRSRELSCSSICGSGRASRWNSSQESPPASPSCTTSPWLSTLWSAARDALERLGVGVPPRASPEAKPLGNFFARDPNGRDIEAGRPREPAQLSPSGSEGPAFFASDEETIRRFYGGALGVDVCPVPCALIAKTSQGDRIDLLNSDGMEPALVVKLESIGRARQWLEERPARAAYPESLEIQPGARTTLVMQDPDGMVMRIEHKGAGPPLSDTCPAGPLSLSHVALRASDIERPWPSTAMFSVSRKPRGCAMPT
jgi:hypothetical protein